MKKFLTLLTIALSLVIINHSCKPDPEDELLQESGSIYGVVTDFATGEPVKNANVQLRPSGETTLTGSDGRYEFLDLPNGNYSITVSKAEYTDLIDDFVITVKTGRSMRRDVQIKKIPTTLQIIDNNGNQISSLDFGNDVDSKQFVIFNSGTVAIECNVVASCEWIKSVSNVINPILPGSVCSVIITIDRSKLHAGINTTYVHVVSNNGNRELKITATGKELLPQVTTLPVTYIDGSDSPFNNTFNAEVTQVGNPPYFKRGFCYSSTNTTPTISDYYIEVPGTGLGKYQYTEWDFPPYTETYYVRAWLMYGDDSSIIYGNVKSFTFNDVKK